MTTLPEIIDVKLLARMIWEGYVKVQLHPTRPLAIYNYTPKTQFERAWNDVTRACRGLIVNFETEEVVARPFPKFFNYGEDTSTLDLDAQVTVTDKADGSLGIIYKMPGDGNGYSVATRGSFTSEQAVEAILMMDDLYSGWTPPDGVTVLVEIIYPENRIVLDYDGARELRLIEALWIDRGWPIASDPLVTARVLDWPGPFVQPLGTMAMGKALQIPPRANAEGIVARYLDTDTRIKIKQADYVALHRVLTKTSARTIWEYLAVDACRDVIDPAKPKHWGSRLGVNPQRAQEILSLGDEWRDRLLASTPDEFVEWFNEVVDRLYCQVRTLRSWVAERTSELVDVARGPDHEFKRAVFFDVARRVEPERWGLLARDLDGQDYTTDIWKHVRPGVETPFMNRSADAE